MFHAKKTGIMVLILLTFSLSACVRHQELPVYDEVLVYQLPYDLTYLRALEALQHVPGWELMETEKEKGIIRVNNVNFSSFSDSDQREATIIVQRMNRHETSVTLAPYSRRVLGGEELLASISKRISAEL